MSSIDLMILGIVSEKPQSAYDVQKDVEYHNLSEWTKISAPSVYRKVIQLKDKGYLKSRVVKGSKFADKAVYSITAEGEKYFNELMDFYAGRSVPLLFDFNVVITNLNKVSKNRAAELIFKLRQSIKASARASEEYSVKYADIPLSGRTIFKQQKLLYDALLKWLDEFEKQISQA